jgi:hypothetical protein
MYIHFLILITHNDNIKFINSKIKIIMDSSEKKKEHYIHEQESFT